MRPRVLALALFQVAFIISLMSMTLNHAFGQTFASGVLIGHTPIPESPETSGMAISRNNENVIWLKSDGGIKTDLLFDGHSFYPKGTQVLVAAAANGAALIDYRIPYGGDFEDMALGAGPVPGVQYLYLGDIGDNSLGRPGYSIYRVPEPVVYADQVPTPISRELRGGQQIALSYGPGVHVDAESMFMDPVLGDLYILGKAGSSQLYKVSASDLATSTSVTAQFVETIVDPLNKLSGGTISPTGREIVLRREEQARLWVRNPGETVAQALARTPVGTPLIDEGNGEAIAFDPQGNYYATGEGGGAPIYYYERTSGDKISVATTLVPAGSEWHYLDDGSDQGTAWLLPGFNDSSWQQADGQFGYGDGDEKTLLNYGGDPNSRNVTSYFRTTFEATDPSEFSQLLVKLVADDGAAVFLNGVEVLRKDLASGAMFNDRATVDQSDFEDTWFTYNISAALLQAGTNTLAVEVHQFALDSNDMSFDLQLHAVPEPAALALGILGAAMLGMFRRRR